MKTCVYILGLLALLLCCYTGRSRAEECGIQSQNMLEPLIHEGYKAERGEFPWHVALYMRYVDDTGEWIQHCGGTLISHNLVLTAAHCVVLSSGALKTSNIKVGLGKINRGIVDTEYSSVIASVKEVVVPLDYFGSATNYAYDIALLQLSESVQYTEYIRPACVDWNQTVQLTVNETFSVAGWGDTVQGSHTGSELLLAAMLSYLDYRTCVQRVISENKKAAASITLDKICAQMLHGSQVMKGDSGGGMIVQRNEKHFVVGIVSVGLNAGVHLPPSITMFTNLAQHMAWLARERLRLISKDLPVSECGIRSNNIASPTLNGQGLNETYRGQFPWHAVLYKRHPFRRDWENRCGGILISRNLILTSALCATKDDSNVKWNASDLKVGLGKIYPNMYHTEELSVNASVKDILFPSTYIASPPYSRDIAVLQLSERVQYTDFIRPACVDWDQTFHLTDTQSAYMTGWRGIEVRREVPLRVVMLSYLELGTCQETLENYRRKIGQGDPRLFHVPDDKFCAKTSDDSPEMAPGYGGGGFYVVKNDRHYVIGISSTGFDKIHIEMFTNITDTNNMLWLKQVWDRTAQVKLT